MEILFKIKKKKKKKKKTTLSIMYPNKTIHINERVYKLIIKPLGLDSIDLVDNSLISP